MVKNIDTASDWLNMFTKVSERLYLAFISKMPKRTAAQQQRFNEQRRANKSKSRQALFISEYIQAKYFDVYSEACSFFNDLNSTYATKYDLRKTSEFRQWKMHINGEILKNRKRTPLQYLDVENVQQTSTGPKSPPPPQSPTGTESPPQSPTGTESPPQSPTGTESPPQSPTGTESPPQSPTGTESPPQSPTGTESPPQSPTGKESPPQSPTGTESPPQSPTGTESPPQSPTGTESPPQSPTGTGSPPQTPPTESQSSPTKYNDMMQLKIPLLSYNTCEKSPSTVTTQTLGITTEQEIDPITLNDIPDEKISEIIEQLRQDPDLKDIFTDIEQQIEFDQLGMDIDVSEQNLLEEELFW